MKAIAIPYLKTLVECVNKMVTDGYTEDFTVADGKLKSLKTEKLYSPAEVSVVNFFRFEGQSDPQDNSILYAIETSDGAKGTLIDAYGPYADENISKFMTEVEKMEKKPRSEK
ncbi:hypothetical protein [Sediminibacterium ginsengisoli]|uniref:Phosphoribosylpyrophosphate synthetase n=1 Tax=Sediminibacterium ginsengisoli TaxID=413434 RepID=A0A1T4Q158_9BACT|nr:hypothetical protein [Sediminibacterium ginsengisoli]SJZ97560.1 hypothetical protein SAMN04488132_10789 [Sediminibacterium ginsengisoli]